MCIYIYIYMFFFSRVGRCGDPIVCICYVGKKVFSPARESMC